MLILPQSSRDRRVFKNGAQRTSSFFAFVQGHLRCRSPQLAPSCGWWHCITTPAMEGEADGQETRSAPPHGAMGAIAPNTTLFATTAYQHNVDGNHQFAWTGRAGVTMRW
jgi:hypothetical protein